MTTPWGRFISANPDQKDHGNLSIAVTEVLMGKLRAVNRQVNAFGYENDRLNKWGILENGEDGDCQHLVVTKRKMLHDLGVPLECLKPAVCHLPRYVAGGGYHAVLIVTTDAEWVVLDNICPWPVEISKLYNYRFITMLNEGSSWKAC
jgi:predicted transglutaminase-like cysteine proteinase